MNATAAAGLMAALIGLVPAAGAEVQLDHDPDTGLERWHFRDGALSMELVQRLPDQTRAFFMGRGFDADSADRFAMACVFQAILRNDTKAGTGGPAVAVDLAHWRVERGGVSQPLPLEAQWQKQWEAASQTQGARIAFRWALLPTEQVFHPGDYNWGMVALGAEPDNIVDVELLWHEDGRERHGRVEGVRCPPDDQFDR